MLLILYSCSKSDENQNYEEIPLVSVYLEGFPLNKL